MTREEAARMCEAVVKPTFGTISSNDNNDAYKEAFEMAIAALREVDAMTQELKERRAIMPQMVRRERELLAEKQPNHKTGLVNCGYGGKPKAHQAYDGSWCVQCGACHLTTLYRAVKGTCVTDWNRAMGWEEQE